MCKRSLDSSGLTLRCKVHIAATVATFPSYGVTLSIFDNVPRCDHECNDFVVVEHQGKWRRQTYRGHSRKSPAPSVLGAREELGWFARKCGLDCLAEGRVRAYPSEAKAGALSRDAFLERLWVEAVSLLERNDSLTSERITSRVKMK
jgi:hypothetical protein